MAGATSPQLRQREPRKLSGLHIVAEMIKAIREAGRTPVQWNTFYGPIKVWDGAPTATEAESRQVGSKSKVLEDNLATA